MDKVQIENIEITRLEDGDYLISFGWYGRKRLPFERVVTRQELISLKMAINRIKK